MRWSRTNRQPNSTSSGAPHHLPLKGKARNELAQFHKRNFLRLLCFCPRFLVLYNEARAVRRGLQFMQTQFAIHDGERSRRRQFTRARGVSKNARSKFWGFPDKGFPETSLSSFGGSRIGVPRRISSPYRAFGTPAYRESRPFFDGRLSYRERRRRDPSPFISRGERKRPALGGWF